MELHDHLLKFDRSLRILLRSLSTLDVSDRPLSPAARLQIKDELEIYRMLLWRPGQTTLVMNLQSEITQIEAAYQLYASGTVPTTVQAKNDLDGIRDAETCSLFTKAETLIRSARINSQFIGPTHGYLERRQMLLDGNMILGTLWGVMNNVQTSLGPIQNTKLRGTGGIYDRLLQRWRDALTKLNAECGVI